MYAKYLWVPAVIAALTGGRMQLHSRERVANRATRSSVSSVSVSLPPQLSPGDANPGDTVARDLCLTIAVGPSAAAECGDLRIVHELPTVRTFNQERTPILLYNSQSARPYPIVSANVILPSGTTGLNRVVATLRVDGVARGRGVWRGTSWPSAAAVRIAVGYDALSDVTGIYRYTLDVTAHYTTDSATSQLKGRLAVVNQSASPFGAGWWLAGLERVIVDLSGNPAMWIDGDGSVRRYAADGPDKWRAPSVTRRDSLVRDAGGTGFARFLSGGTRVVFDAQGRHVKTVNRLGRETVFGYDPSGRLSTITVPGGKIYTFLYGSSVIREIDAPGEGNTSRATTFASSSGRIAAITDPDLSRVTFAYPNTTSGVITSRTDRTGAATTYRYNNSRRLIATRLDASPQDSIVLRLRPVESVGLSDTTGNGAVSVDSAYAIVDGPRTDVADTTKFWLDRFGAPRRIRNSLGDTTRLERANASFPGLVTSLVRANGFRSDARYDLRGNVDTLLDFNPLGDGRTATTSFAWDAKWDMVTRIVHPEGDEVSLSYDPTTGNRLWSQPGTDPARRVLFTYGSDGQLSSVTAPLGLPDSVFYDVSGNLQRERSPLGFVVRYFKDGLGRDTLVQSPVDSLQQSFRFTRYAYDAADRVTQSTDSAGVLSLTVRTTFDSEGRAIAISRFSSPDPAAVGDSKDSIVYDKAGRKTRQIDVYSLAAETWAYDPAGNVVADTTRTGDWAAMRYDALNRLSMRIIPSVGSNYTPFAPDTSTFAYDNAGNVTVANNRFARINRSYNLAGSVATDTLRIRTASVTIADFNQHVYGLRYSYDLNGRRTRLEHPASISIGADTTKYEYGTATGLLSAVVDGAGNRYEYRYDLALRPVALAMPGGVVDSTIYDYDDRRRLRIEVRGADTLHRDRISLDGAGRVLAVATYPGLDPADFSYTGLGAISRSFLRNETDIFLSLDAFGNRITRRRITDESTGNYTFVYEPHSTRLSRVGGSFGGASHPGRDTLSQGYDRAGSLTGTTYTSWADTVPPFTVGPLWGVTSFATSTNRYAADGHAMYSTRSTSEDIDRTDHFHLQQYGYTALVSDPSLGRGVYEEYRYDALGRRVWVWSHRDPYCKPGDANRNTECLSAIQRTVWDGDQVLYEIRQRAESTALATDLERDKSVSYPGPARHFGITSYVHGAGVDEPLALVRDLGDLDGGVQRLALHRTWRGEVDMTTWAAGTTNPVTIGATADCPPNPPSGCVRASWPGRESNIDYARTRNDSGPPSWYGNLSQDLRDGTGQIYKRNRYFDPVTGRFTQEDPIGLGGGMNLYGLANGDPVNYADPFGLCPPETRWTPECDRPLASPGLLDPVLFLSEGVAAGLRIFAGRILGGLLGRTTAGALEGLVEDVSNPALRNTIRALYKSTDEIPGGTAGAIRNEAITGQATKGSFHLEKGVQRATNLRRILTRETLNDTDRVRAQHELHALEDAIRFAKNRAR